MLLKRISTRMQLSIDFLASSLRSFNHVCYSCLLHTHCTIVLFCLHITTQVRFGVIWYHIWYLYQKTKHLLLSMEPKTTRCYYSKRMTSVELISVNKSTRVQKLLIRLIEEQYDLDTWLDVFKKNLALDWYSLHNLRLHRYLFNTYFGHFAWSTAYSISW